MSYLALKYLHIACVILSGSGFFLRGIWMLIGSPMLQRRWVRVVPHIVDTVLLSSAVALAVISAQYPLVLDWLTAKVVGLSLYIGFGMMALRRAKTRRARAAFFVAALFAFAYIVCVALTRDPLGFLAVPLGG